MAGLCNTNVRCALPVTSPDTPFLADGQLIATGPQLQVEQTLDWDSVLKLEFRGSLASLSSGQLSYLTSQSEISGYLAAAQGRLFAPIRLQKSSQLRLLLMGGFGWDQTYAKTKPLGILVEEVPHIIYKLKFYSLTPCAGLFIDIKPTNKLYSIIGLTSYFPRREGRYPLNENLALSPKEILKISRIGWGFEMLCRYSTSSHCNLEARIEYKGLSTRGAAALPETTENAINRSFIYQEILSFMLGIALTY